MGFITLGIVAIGLIALWTGYRQRECRAWFVMLIILLCFVFPTDVLQLLVQMHVAGWRSSLEFLEEYWTVKGWWGCFMRPPLYVVGLKYVPIITVAMLLRFLVMLFALLLPVKAFFWKSYNPNVSDEQNGGLFVGDK